MIAKRKFVQVPKEFCPQAVIDWCVSGDENGRGNGDGAETKRKAKSHLAAVGWTFWLGKKNDRWELRYKSPSSEKSYYSLRTACKACIDAGDANPDSAVISDDVQGRLVPEKVESFSQENIASPIVNTPNGKSPAESSNSNSNSDSATSASKRGRPRKRKLDFEPVLCESVNDQVSQELNSGDNLDVHVDQKPCCSSEQKPVVKPGKVIATSKSAKESQSDDKKRTKKRQDGGVVDGTERVRKTIPNIRGGGNSSQTRRKPRMALEVLLDNNVVKLGDKVTYRGKSRSSGEITREGIKCHCCSVVFALTAFEGHVGSTNHRPAANILLEDGRSLMDCKNQIQCGGDENVGSGDGGHRARRGVSTKGKNEHSMPSDGSDDICSVCQFGGELVLCDRCPSAYHPSCLGFEAAPDGDWFCPSCCCEACGNGKFEQEDQACGVVGNDGGDILVCDQCERKFHLGCLRKSGVNPNLESGSVESLFCSKKCEDVCSGLRALVGKPIQIGKNGLTWTLLKSGRDNPKLEAALAVMHQCFEPTRDPLTKRDTVEDVIFGQKSELSRLNFKGFHVVVLERGADEMISVATVRVYGCRMAEVPLVATGFAHQGRGMCHVLMDELEKQLVDMGVERLTLPSASTMLQTWVTKFRFSEMSVGERLGFLSYNPLDFQGTVMCQKLLVKKKRTVEVEMESESIVPMIEDLPVAEAKDHYASSAYCPSEVGTSAICAESFINRIDMAAKLVI